MSINEAPESSEQVGTAPTRRAVLAVGGGMGLAVFLASCGVRGLSAVPATTTSPLVRITATSPLVRITATSPLVRITATSPCVRITTTGATFNPTVELAAGSTATVSWAVEGGATVTGINPTISYGTAATRHIRMTVDDGGTDALDEVMTFNLGFNHVDDSGSYNMGARHDKPGQEVTLVENVSRLKGLVRFAAANIPTLAGTLDFTGCSRLQYVECAYSRVQSVVLTGCTSLIRLCLEQNDLTTLNLNPVAANLRDVRGAKQRGGSLTLTPLTAPLAALYHFCVRDQIVVNHPTAVQLPVVEERWDWFTSQSGALTSGSSAIRSLLTSGNHYTTADLTDQFPAGRSGELNVGHCRLTSLVLAGCSGLWSIDARDNHLSQAGVDAVLAEVDSWATGGGRLRLQMNAEPSVTGVNHVTALMGRNWTVTTDG